MSQHDARAVIGGIPVEVWWFGKGSRAVWTGELPAIPRAGDDIATGSGGPVNGKVERVTWALGAERLYVVRIYVDER